MGKTIFLLFISLMFFGCASPREIYNVKSDKLNELHQNLRKNTAMSGIQTELLYWAEVKKEFPEYEEGVDYILGIIQKHKEKKANGQSLNEDDKKEYFTAFNKFWKDVETDYRLRQSEYDDRNDFLWTLSHSLNEFNKEMNENNRRLYEMERMNRPLRCTTSFIGSTAYTDCY